MIYQQCSPQAHIHKHTLAYTVEAGHKLSVYLDSAKSKRRAGEGVAVASEFQLLLDFMHAKLVHNKFAAASVVLLLLCLGSMDTLANVLQCANES